MVIGDALIDELRTPSGSTDVAGGSALNVAVGLAILGVPTTLIAMIGDDADGDLLRAFATGFGVRVESSRAPLGTGRAISDRTHGEPRYSFNEASVQRTIDCTPTMLAAIADAPLVAISGFPFDNPAEFSALQAALGSASVLIDPNPRPGLLLSDSRFRFNLEALGAGSALVKIGEEDAHLLYGEDVASVVDHYLALGAHAVLATMGRDGATLHVPDGATHRDIVTDARPIVDTMGAGDATFAAVIAGLVGSDASPTEWGVILDTAMGIAAETIRVAGGQLRVPGH